MRLGVLDRRERAPQVFDRRHQVDAPRILADPLDAQPTTFNASQTDTTVPVIASHEPRDVFVDTATLHFVTDEPSDAVVEVGPAGGSFQWTFSDAALLVTHDVVLFGLPAGTALQYRITAKDKNQNAAVVTSTTGEEADTVIDSSSDPTFMSALIAVVKLAGRSTFSRLIVAKPVRLKVTTY